jgi:hypothetical protein
MNAVLGRQINYLAIGCDSRRERHDSIEQFRLPLFIPKTALALHSEKFPSFVPFEITYFPRRLTRRRRLRAADSRWVSERLT